MPAAQPSAPAPVERVPFTGGQIHQHQQHSQYLINGQRVQSTGQVQYSGGAYEQHGVQVLPRLPSDYDVHYNAADNTQHLTRHVSGTKQISQVKMPAPAYYNVQYNVVDNTQQFPGHIGGSQYVTHMTSRADYNSYPRPSVSSTDGKYQVLDQRQKYYLYSPVPFGIPVQESRIESSAQRIATTGAQTATHVSHEYSIQPPRVPVQPQPQPKVTVATVPGTVTQQYSMATFQQNVQQNAFRGAAQCTASSCDECVYQGCIWVTYIFCFAQFIERRSTQTSETVTKVQNSQRHTFVTIRWRVLADAATLATEAPFALPLLINVLADDQLFTLKHSHEVYSLPCHTKTILTNDFDFRSSCVQVVLSNFKGRLLIINMHSRLVWTPLVRASIPTSNTADIMWI